MAYHSTTSLAVLLTLCYIAVTIFYRLLLHPLRSVPGPKLAAITRGYEMYFDLIQPARFPWQLRKLHEEYGTVAIYQLVTMVEFSNKYAGPIVRIAPNEVHINDVKYTETHLSSSSAIKMNKYVPHQQQFGMPDSTFNTIDAAHHKLRRGVLNPFFSRRSINTLEPMLREKVEKTCSRLQQGKETRTPIDLRLLFSCMTTDIITEYAYSNCFHLLDDPELAPEWRNTFHEGLRNFQWLKHFPSLWRILRGIP
jgi:hypothetical protein